MIDYNVTFELPVPWSASRFETDVVGSINYLVGPNGSGKSRFALALLHQLKAHGGSARFLSTDRLREMVNLGRAGKNWGDAFNAGYAKRDFDVLRRTGAEGSGIDTVLLLEERMDLRIQIEATLSHLFGRDVLLEWDSGNLVPKAVRRETGESYRLDRDECHGIKELFVLLTHLYDTEQDYLIIDEPELNLHPQSQAFFMQEVRKVAGDPSEEPNKKKVVFLITHSPFILDIRREDDLKSVISFDLNYSIPRQIARTSADVSSALIASRRLNAHHKQLFFSDNPVFVEGHHDALMIEALVEARGGSAPAAGSCVIDCGGVGEVNHFLRLAQALKKEAHFVYDLDSLFHGQLRRSVSGDDHVQGLLLSAGVGPNFATYVGQLDSLLTDLIDNLLGRTLSGNLEGLERLFDLFGKGNRKQWAKDQLAKARIAVMTAIAMYRDDVISAAGCDAIIDIEGRWQKILSILKEKNIHVLPGGSMECYMPSFSGDLLEQSHEAKQNAVVAELQELQRIQQSVGKGKRTMLKSRYGELYAVVRRLPAKAQVEVDNVLRGHLIDYVHELQKALKANPDWKLGRVETHMRRQPLATSGVVSLDALQRDENGGFSATIALSEMFEHGRRFIDVDSNTTITNMRAFRDAGPV